ncbi:DUF1851 domain-containing protein [Oxalobacteraceae bacterium OTU3CAMAD1]|nr:DUF1851 domain-containing protein [Oxalobacteraceae bacterium OTU3CAMAD1]
MSPYFEEFLVEFPRHGDAMGLTLGSLCCPIELSKYREELPATLLEFWTEVGWSGYANGLMWSTNPDQFTPILDAWLGSLNFFKQDSYNVVARGAFGKLYLWGKSTGSSIIIDPLISMITTVEPRLDPSKSDTAITSFFLSKEKKNFDFEDHKEKPLFARALKKLGPLKVDEMYGFEPALSIGGVPKLENLVKVKMIEHLVLLSQLGQIEVTHLDISRHVGS